MTFAVQFYVYVQWNWLYSHIIFSLSLFPFFYIFYISSFFSIIGIICIVYVCVWESHSWLMTIFISFSLSHSFKHTHTYIATITFTWHLICHFRCHNILIIFPYLSSTLKYSQMMIFDSFWSLSRHTHTQTGGKQGINLYSPSFFLLFNLVFKSIIYLFTSKFSTIIHNCLVHLVFMFSPPPFSQFIRLVSNTILTVFFLVDSPKTDRMNPLIDWVSFKTTTLLFVCLWMVFFRVLYYYDTRARTNTKNRRCSMLLWIIMNINRLSTYYCYIILFVWMELSMFDWHLMAISRTWNHSTYC